MSLSGHYFFKKNYSFYTGQTLCSEAIIAVYVGICIMLKKLNSTPGFSSSVEARMAKRFVEDFIAKRAASVNKMSMENAKVVPGKTHKFDCNLLVLPVPKYYSSLSIFRKSLLIVIDKKNFWITRFTMLLHLF